MEFNIIENEYTILAGVSGIRLAIHDYLETVAVNNVGSMLPVGMHVYIAVRQVSHLSTALHG